MQGDHIAIEPLSNDAFAPFGDIIALKFLPDFLINQGMCGRHHNLARLNFSSQSGSGQAAISLFDAVPRSFPYVLDMMERHPLGSQAFLPMHEAPFLVIVAPDDEGRPGTPRAFVTQPGQGINLLANIWHGVLTPLASKTHRSGLFAVVDRVGEGNNLEEVWFDEPYVIVE